MSNDKFVSKKGEMQLLKNSDLDCRDCIFANKDETIVANCVMYQQQKPGSVIYGGTCDKKCTSVEEARKKNIKM